TSLTHRYALSLHDALPIFQCYEGIDAQQALYDWDFARQILHLRTLEASGGDVDVDATEGVLHSERFLLARPVLRALQQSPAVLRSEEHTSELQSRENLVCR